MLKLNAMGFSYDSSFWDDVLCDTSENSNCWLAKCDKHREEKKFIPKKQMDSKTICKQCKTILVPANRKGNQNDKNEEPQKFKKLQIVSDQVTVGEIFNSHFKMLLLMWIWKESRPMHLNHFMPLISFDTPWKHQKTRGFPMFSGGIKRDQWHEMG